MFQRCPVLRHIPLLRFLLSKEKHNGQLKKAGLTEIGRVKILVESTITNMNVLHRILHRKKRNITEESEEQKTDASAMKGSFRPLYGHYKILVNVMPVSRDMYKFCKVNSCTLRLQ